MMMVMQKKAMRTMRTIVVQMQTRASMEQDWMKEGPHQIIEAMLFIPEYMIQCNEKCPKIGP